MKIINRIFSLCLIALVFLASNCERNPFVENVSRISFQNNSTKNISIGYSLLYPNISIADIPQYNVITIPVGDDAPIDSKKDWEKVITNDIPGKKLLVFVFSVAVNDNNWEEVKSNYLVKKIYELSVDDLKASNWIISYTE